MFKVLSVMHVGLLHMCTQSLQCSLFAVHDTGNLLRVHQASVLAAPKYSKHMQYIVSGILDNVMLPIL
jgi:hypothetical protein